MFVPAILLLSNPIDPLVAAERAFAADVAVRGIKTGFLAVFDDRSLVFTPGPVKGVDAYGAIEDSKAQLLWEPQIAAISKDGTMGFTTGPYRLPKPENPKESSGTGHFLSVWRKTASGWRIVFDAGAPGPAPKVKAYDVRALKVEGRSSQQEHTTSDADANTHVSAYLDRDSRLYFPRREASVGVRAFLRTMNDVGLAGMTTTQIGLTSSGDIGWSVGEATLAGKPAFFARVWRHDTGGWKIAAQTVLPGK